MITQSLNHILFMSLVHTITSSHPSLFLGTHNHSIISFKHSMLTHHSIASYYPHIIEQSRPFDPKYPTQTITQSYLSNIPCSHNHSITSFYCPLHTQSLHHIILASVFGSHNHFITSFYPHILEQFCPFDPKHPTHSNIPCSYNHSITSFYLLSFALTITSSHPSILTYSNNFALLTKNILHTQSFNHIFQSSHAHTITQLRPSFVLCAHNLPNTSS